MSDGSVEATFPQSLAAGSAGWPVRAWLDHPPGALDPVAARQVRASANQADPELVRWLTSVLRFTRADGSSIFGPRGRSSARLIVLERWVRQLGEPALARVIGWWRPASAIAATAEWTAPPLPTETWSDQPLAVLRPDWTLRGSCVAVDHRMPGPATTIEVAGRGVTWLGPDWTSPPLEAQGTAASAMFAATGPFADAYEWSWQAGPVTVTRTASLIRGAGLALLLQTEVGVSNDVGEIRWSLPVGIEARPDPTSRAWVLSAGRGRPTARLIALGLPEANYVTDRGSLVIEGNEVILRQRAAGPNRCLALLIAWSNKPPRSWRVVTVAEKSAPCAPGAAFAARVGWGTGQHGLLIYRSLGPAGLRSCLGHQTKARLIIAGFQPTGEVHPWIKANEPAVPTA